MTPAHLEVGSRSSEHVPVSRERALPHAQGDVAVSLAGALAVETGQQLQEPEKRHGLWTLSRSRRAVMTARAAVGGESHVKKLTSKKKVKNRREKVNTRSFRRIKLGNLPTRLSSLSTNYIRNPSTFFRSVLVFLDPLLARADQHGSPQPPEIPLLHTELTVVEWRPLLKTRASLGFSMSASLIFTSDNIR